MSGEVRSTQCTGMRGVECQLAEEPTTANPPTYCHLSLTTTPHNINTYTYMYMYTALTRVIKDAISVALKEPVGKQFHYSVNLLRFTGKMEAAEESAEEVERKVTPHTTMGCVTGERPLVSFQ